MEFLLTHKEVYYIYIISVANNSLSVNNNSGDKDIFQPLSKPISKPISPPEFLNNNGFSDAPSPNENSHRHSRKNVKDLLSSNANTFIIGKNKL